MVAVLAEVFARVFDPYWYLLRATVRWYIVSLGALLACSIGLVFLFPTTASAGLTATVVLLNRSAAILFCGAFGFMALFSSYFGLPWQHRTYGIGLGFLLFLGVDVIMATAITAYGIMPNTIWQEISMLAYSLATVTWLGYFSRSYKDPELTNRDALHRLHQALAYRRAKLESDGSIPGDSNGR